MKSRLVGLSLLFLSTVFAGVDGTVVNRTTGQPQSGATVTLYKLGSAGMESVESVKSGAGGVFHINETPQGPHLIQTAFDGVTYNHMLPPGSATSGVTLDVFNSSKQPGAARISRHFLIFQPVGAQLNINEGFILSNTGNVTYNDPDGGTLKFFLPVATKGIVQVKATAPQGMPIDRAADKTSQKDVYKIDFPIKPGETSVQVSYSVPYSAGAVYEGRTFGVTAEPTLLVVPNGVTLTGDGLQNRGQEPRSKATVYSVATAAYKVTLAGAMAAATPSDGDAGDNGGPSLEEISPKVMQSNMKWILVLAFGILALGFIMLYRAQPDQRRVLASAGLKPGGEKNERGRR